MIVHFEDEYVEELIHHIYYQLIDSYPKYSDQIIDYEGLNGIAHELLNEDVIDSLYNENQQLNYLTETAFLGVLTTATLGLTIFNTQPISKNWLDLDEEFDPNNWIGHILMTIAQNGLGIIQLNMLGVDSPSRIVLRSLVEHTWIYSIISMDKNYFLEYKNSLHNENSKRWWNKFRPQKLKSKLKSLEEEIGLPKINRDHFQNFRENVFSHYSQATHMSPLAGLVSPYRGKFDEEGFEFRIFAGATSGSLPILKDLNESLHYIHLMIYPILGFHHNYKIEDHLDNWASYYSLNWYYTTLMAYLEDVYQ